MQTAVYVDVLLVLNYVVTALLLECTAKLLGTRITRRKIVIAALLGALGSLTIFLPFMGFFAMLATRILLSAIIVAAATSWSGFPAFLKAWFVFFAVNFFFAGVMLGIWMLFAPQGMLYYNGVVYFNLNPITLLVTTVAAYLILSLASRMSRGGRLKATRCRATLKLNGKTCSLEALVDTGNSLYEPFSGIPVIVCRLEAVSSILEPDLSKVLRQGNWENAPGIRLIPYSAVGVTGALPALRLDELFTDHKGVIYKTDFVYMAVTTEKIGADGCVAILNPDLIGTKAEIAAGTR